MENENDDSPILENPFDAGLAFDNIMNNRIDDDLVNRAYGLSVMRMQEELKNGDTR